jgi:hypothetical protein
MMDLGIALLHPDDESIDFLGEISEYMIPSTALEHKLSEYDKELASIIKERVKEIKYV